MTKLSDRLTNLKTSPNDVIYTPKPVAMKMISMCNITPDMTVLDCSRGAGVFYDNLPPCKKDWCEITDGKDFFEYNKRVDLIISNPPFSLWNKWLEKTMQLTDKFCFIMSSINFTDTRMKNIIENGFGITQIHLLRIEWWFGNALIVIFEKNKPSIITVEDKRIQCDICGNRCNRGRKPIGMNECSPIIKKVK